MRAPPPPARRPRRRLLRAIALASVPLFGAGCSFALVRPTPRTDRCNSLLLPILDGSAGAIAVGAAVASNRSTVRPDCPETDTSCYKNAENRRSDVRAWSTIAAFYAASTAWGVWARSHCRETLASLPPPVLPEPVPVPVPVPEPAPAAEAMPKPLPAEPPPPGKRAMTYLSGWIGYGGGAVLRREDSTAFIPPAGLPLSAGVGLGLHLGDRLQLGVEWNGTAGINCLASMNSASGPCDRTTTLQHILLAATWYPLWVGPPETAPAGLFVRGGPALVLLRSTFSSDEPFGAPPPPPSKTARWQRTGGGVLVGAGYAVRIGLRRTRTLDGGFDVAWQRYGSSPSLPESSFSTFLHMGVTFH